LHAVVDMRLLLVEDDPKIGAFVMKGLKAAGFAVDYVTDGENGLALALNTPYDAAVIDIMLPKLDGLALIERMRRQNVDIPVIILSARRSVDDRIRGLQTGGDDYLTKPFSFSELLARVQALIRRAGKSVEPAVLTFDDLSLNLYKREVYRGSTRIDLQPREFALLEYFMHNPERVLSKAMILEHVWDYSFDPQTNVVDVLVCRLRNKIERDFEAKLIHTLRGVGYVLRGT